MTPKKIGKAFICRLLERQVKHLLKKHPLTIVAVAGSVGKTSTKLAIAKTLAASRKVIYQEGNYNDRLTVPLVLFGQAEPNILNPFAWARILWQNSRKLKKAYPYDIAVLEFGVDGMGQMKAFSYLSPNLMLISAVAPEHMEYFGTLDNVAKEELSALTFSKQSLLNLDDISHEYLPDNNTYTTYGLRAGDYSVAERQVHELDGQDITFSLKDGQTFSAKSTFLGEQGAKIALAAVAAAHMVGLSTDEIVKGIEQVQPFAGRMQVLEGVSGSKLIDDTYNASPLAVKAALDVLYEVDSPQRIAVLGSMNEMGEGGAGMHKEMGEYCDPDKLSLVVAVGKQAGEFLAPAALARGCTVKTFLNPYEAGEFVKSQLKEGAVILAKGSQNGVFAEEALKQLLANPDDANKLVRQSAQWLRIKARQFK